MDRLKKGDRLPSLTAERVEGDSMTLPEDLDGDWSLLVFYRGHW